MMSTEDYFIAAGLRPRKKKDPAKRRFKKGIRCSKDERNDIIDTIYHDPSATIDNFFINVKDLAPYSSEEHNQYEVKVNVTSQNTEVDEVTIGYFDTEEEAEADIIEVQLYLAEKYGI